MSDEVITVRLEYGGIRVERSATSPAEAQAKLADMYREHGITPCKSNPLHGRTNLTNARTVARFVGLTPVQGTRHDGSKTATAWLNDRAAALSLADRLAAQPGMLSAHITANYSRGRLDDAV